MPDYGNTSPCIHYCTIGLWQCIAVWFYISRLQRIQNNAARLVTGTSKYSHITPVLINLHWLPVAQRIQYKILLTVFKCLHGLAPVYLTELIVLYIPNRPLRSAGANLLVVPKSRTKSYGDRSFSVAGPTLWNSLPESIRVLDGLVAFKRQLKTHLFKVAFDL